MEFFKIYSLNIAFLLLLVYYIKGLFNKSGEKMKKRTRRQKAILKRRIFLSFASIVLVALLGIFVYIGKSLLTDNDNNDKTPSNSQGENTETEKQDFESRVTILSTGDIMVHSTQLDGAKVKGTNEYDFSAFFKETAPYFKKADLSVANLEVTFGGTAAGAYRGYPSFNTPDSLADAIKESGLSFLLTANNHSYDTGFDGLIRTAQVLKERNIEFIGTRETEQDSIYTVKDINGIKIGMANFTYSTYNSSTGVKALNGLSMKKEANELVSTFSYDRLDEFYTNAENTISDMKQKGAEFIVFYMHWGNEYWYDTVSTYQKTIAQELSNLGVNIIIGSHPHVIEPIDLIYSEDGENTTVCVYSTGNAVSNQRQELMDSCPTGHTEDGMLFYYTLHKKNDTVTLESVDVIPTWVNKYKGGSGYQYTIYPLENEDFGSTYSLDSTTLTKSKKSYNRTKALLQEGLTEVQKHLGCEITFK